MRVVAAVSGGVDSAVALARAVAAGHDVTAVHLALTPDPAISRQGTRGCCTLSDAHDARRAADKVGVPFYVWDVAAEFQERVVADFVAEYEQGRTPNPCVRCNEHIKFAAVLDRALALGFDAVATGHYAQLDHTDQGPVLRRAIDPGKDQSYVLAVLGAQRLQHCLFPVGDTHKSEIRLEAQQLGLTVAKKPDSHDICFIPDGDTAGFLSRRLGEKPGTVVDHDSGETLASHGGTFGFTIGQRRGLGIPPASNTGSPRYVVDIDPVENKVVVGGKEHLQVWQLGADQAIWCAEPVVSSESVFVQVRAHGRAIPAHITSVDQTAGTFAVELAEALVGVAPGQSLVIYRDDVVVGQGCVTDSHLPSGGKADRLVGKP